MLPGGRNRPAYFQQGRRYNQCKAMTGCSNGESISRAPGYAGHRCAMYPSSMAIDRTSQRRNALGVCFEGQRLPQAFSSHVERAWQTMVKRIEASPEGRRPGALLQELKGLVGEVRVIGWAQQAPSLERAVQRLKTERRPVQHAHPYQRICLCRSSLPLLPPGFSRGSRINGHRRPRARTAGHRIAGPCV